MKKLKLICAVLFSLTLTSATSPKSLFYTLKNQLNCDVTIAYEMYDGSCNVCATGTTTIPANTTQNLSLCPGYQEICIIIMDIGGSTPAANHSNVVGMCHNMTPYGQSGSGVGVACSSTGNWTATHTTGSWTIN